MKKQIIRLTENDLQQIIRNSVKQVIKEEKINEGWKNTLGSAALGATMAMSPLNANAQQHGFVRPNQIETTVDTQIQQYVVSEIKKNTMRNKQIIHAVEKLMRQDESVADDIYSIALMDEYDNFIVLGDNLSKDDYNTLSQQMEREDLVTINYYDNGRRISNVIVPLERLETLLERY